MKDFRYLTIAAVAAVGLTLAACGGGGSSSTSEAPVVEPMLDPAIAQREAIDTAIMTAQTAVNAVNDDSEDAEVTAADTAIAAARSAITAAGNVPAEEKAANTGTVDALSAQLAGAKSSRQMAMDDAAEMTRMANISTAQGVLATAQAAVDALADDATDEEQRDAHRMVEAAANALRDVLQMNGGSTADIEAAIRAAQTAKVAADALQVTITAEANAEEQRKMMAIETAQTALTTAEDALAALGEDATDKERRAAHRAVQHAAANLIQVLENNDGTADQIEAATMARDSAMRMADALTSPIDIADQRKAITDALETLRVAVAKVNDDATDAEVKAADAAVTAARKAIADATELSEAETDAHGAVVTAHVSILTPAKASRQIAVNKADEEKQKMAREASNKIANTKKAAIGTEAGADADVLIRPFDSTNNYDPAEDADNAATNYLVTVKHDGGPKVTVVDGGAGYTAKNDPKFTRAATFGDGQMLVRNDGTAREIIVLHTDIEAPDNVRFGTSRSGYTFDANVDTDTSANDSYIVPTGDASKLGGSRIVSADPGTKSLAQWEATGDNSDNVFRGTFAGAPGSFRCQDDCTVTTTAGATADDDNVVTLSGVLWFTPDAGATVEIADSDYLTWGFWLETKTKDGAIASYETVQTFATSSLPDATGPLDEVTGTATYEGDAAGVYVHETKNEDGTLDTATSGRFTADVALTADFDGSTTRVANTVAGTISNFDLDGGPANSWNVNVSATIRAADFSLENGVASGMKDNDGSLSGQFHHRADDETGAVGTTPPDALIGEFNANFVNGAVAGAYGARKQ